MVKYSRHARDRRLERNISHDDVMYCLKHYHTSYPDRSDNMIYRADLPDGRHIKVVVKAKTSDPKVIITVADY